jgi:signal transduction histidine kinase
MNKYKIMKYDTLFQTKNMFSGWWPQTPGKHISAWGLSSPIWLNIRNLFWQGIFFDRTHMTQMTTISRASQSSVYTTVLIVTMFVIIVTILIIIWLGASTPLKNISQLGSLFPIYGKS